MKIDKQQLDVWKERAGAIENNSLARPLLDCIDMIEELEKERNMAVVKSEAGDGEFMERTNDIFMEIAENSED